MHVLHLSPTTFGPSGYLGGGERFVVELARAMAARTQVTLLTFGDRRRTAREGGLVIEELPRGLVGRWWHPVASNPVRWSVLRRLRSADVIHAHQPFTFLAAFAVWVGSRLGKPTFLTDLGGGHPYAPAHYLPVLRRATGMLLLSEYSRSLWARQPKTKRPAALEVIFGGVDLHRFSPGGHREPGKVLFVGRLVPHKGLEYLLEAVEPPMHLTVAGSVVDTAYAESLRQAALASRATFELHVPDDRLIHHYRSAIVTVVPSVYRNAAGGTTMVPELLGLVVLESLACGTPVIVTDVASLPELVEDGVTGFVVPPNDPDALRDRLRYCLAHPTEVERMGAAGRAWVAERFRWEQVVERCFRAYRAALGRVSFSGSSPPESPGAMADR